MVRPRPTTCPATEQSIDLSVVTYDLDAEPTILMGVANRMHINQDAQLVLRPDEARTLAEQLLIHYLKAVTPRIPAQRTNR